MSKCWPLRSSRQDIRHVFPLIHLQTGGNEVTVEKLDRSSWVSAETFPPPLIMNIHNESQESLTENCAHMEDWDGFLFHLHRLQQCFILTIVLQRKGDFQRWHEKKTFFFLFNHLAAFLSLCKISLCSASAESWQVEKKRGHIWIMDCRKALRWNCLRFFISFERLCA